MTIDEAVDRLEQLARENDGYLTAGLVEADSRLSSQPETTAAAAHKLATSPGVVCTDSDPDTGWFPYQEMVLRSETRS